MGAWEGGDQGIVSVTLGRVALEAEGAPEGLVLVASPRL